jgi:hypothetical protein
VGRSSQPTFAVISKPSPTRHALLSTRDSLGSPSRRRLVRHRLRLVQDFSPPFKIFPHQNLSPPTGQELAEDLVAAQPQLRPEADRLRAWRLKALTKELLYRYRRYRQHTKGAGIDRPDCNRPAELDPQRRGTPEDSVDDVFLASCK